ncbi:MAG: class I SAM-dependent methyltransferase [bacterium]
MDHLASTQTARKNSPSLEQLHRYWIENRHESTADRDPWHCRAELLERMIRLLGVEDPYVLELGCAAGHNLSHLQQSGLTRLSGIEINPEAVNRLQRNYPNLFDTARIYNLSIEDVMGLFGDAEFDVLCSVNVLSHLHPRSEWVFEELARICSRGMVLVEDERSRSQWDFPRNYLKIFTALGFRQVHEELLTRHDGGPASTLRVFSRLDAR